MQAIRFPAKDRIEVTVMPDPLPAPGEVLVAVRASGVCHTDIEVMRGNYGSSAFPLVPGHEYAGVVLAVGEGVAAVAEGARVVIDPNLECGTCHACRRGWAHLCEALGAYGVTVDGGFAERSVVKAAAVHPIGDMPFHIAALAEPMGCALNGVEAVRAERAENALIFGAGPMGVLVGVALKARGVGDVALVDPDESRLALAEGFGFMPLAAGSAGLEAMRRGADVAIDATGVPAVAAGLVEFIADGGAGLFFGVCPQDARIGIAPFEVFRRQLSLCGSHSLNHNIPEALAAIRACGPGIERLVSHRLSLPEIAAAMRDGAPRGSLKIQAVME
jgi:threonine dehydrogenase-like Zn-dependent dehydrogenase